MKKLQAFSWIAGALGAILIIAFAVYARNSDTMATWAQVTGGVGVALVVLWLWADRESIAEATSTRGAKHTTFSWTLVAIGLAIAVAINLVSHRYDHRWDVTASKKFTLSDQTVSILSGLTAPVEVKAFFPTGSLEESQFKDLVTGYQQHTDQLQLDSHDPLREPMLAQQYKLTSTSGTVVLTSGENQQRLETGFGEEALSNALVRLKSGAQHMVCFTKGHAESDPTDEQTGLGIGWVIDKLQGQNYVVEQVNLVKEGTVPSVCEILVAADPQVDFLAPELEMVARWVAEGHSFVLLLEPRHAPGLAADMARYGIGVGDDLVIEQSSNHQLLGVDASYIFLGEDAFDFHPIVEPLKGMVLLRAVRSVSALEGELAREGINVQVLARSSESSWAETSIDENTTAVEPNPETEIVGNVPVMAVAEVVDPEAVTVRTLTPSTPALQLPGVETASAVIPPDVKRAPGGRVVVIGDVDFATNELLDQVSNLDLLLNTLAWLAGEEDQISIRPNEAAKGTLSMSLLQGLLVWLASLLFVPGACVIGALATWRSRRGR